MEEIQTITQKLEATLGHPVLLQTEFGLCVRNMETFQEVFNTSKPPKSLSADWILKAIEKKTQRSKELKERQEAAKIKIHSYLEEKGLKNNGVNLYFTTTGFSVDNLCRNGLEEAKRILAQCEIEFKRLEYSQAHWVVRVIL